MIYNASTKVYAAKLMSEEFGTTTSCKIVANNYEEAMELAKISFDNYIKALEKHHNCVFKYGEIKLVN